MKKAFNILMVLTAAFLAACNPEDAGPMGPSGGGDTTKSNGSGGATAATRTQLLSGKNWSMTAFKADPGFNIQGVVVTDIYAQVGPCGKDDIVRFNADGTYMQDEGGRKCDEDGPQTVVGRWVFNPQETIITISSLTVDDSESWNILALTERTLKVSYTSYDEDTELYHTMTVDYSAL